MRQEGGDAPKAKDEGPTERCLLQHARSGTDSTIASIYDAMVALVFKAPVATREKFFRQLPQVPLTLT